MFQSFSRKPNRKKQKQNQTVSVRLRGKVSLKKSSADSKVWTTAVSAAEAALTTTRECFGALKLQKRREWKKSLVWVWVWVWGEQFNEKGLNALDLGLYVGFSLKLWCRRESMLTVDMVARKPELFHKFTGKRERLDSFARIVARYLIREECGQQKFALFLFLYLIFLQKVITFFYSFSTSIFRVIFRFTITVSFRFRHSSKLFKIKIILYFVFLYGIL